MIENDIAKLQREVDSLKAESITHTWHHEHLEEIVGLILKDLCVKVVESSGKLKLENTYYE